MAIVISGVNNNDKITAADGTIDLLSGVNYAGIITAPAFTTPGNLTSGHLNVGSNIQLGNAGVATATTFVGNLTGNVNATSNLLLQIGGSEKFRVASSGQLGIGGANYGTSGQVLTSGGSGSAATWSTIPTPDADKIIEGNTKAEVIDTGSAGYFIVETEGSERLRIKSNGQIILGSDGTNSELTFSQDGTSGIILNSTTTGFGGYNTFTVNSAQFVHKYGSNERLRINSSGDVGIGYDSPPCKLAIRDTAEFAAYAGVTPNSSNVLLQLWNNPPNETANDHASMQFAVNGGSHNRVNTISAVAESAGNRKMAFTFCTDEAGSRSEKMRITGDGKVGINSTTPQQALDVRGSINGGSENQPFLRFHDSHGDQRVTKHYFRCTKGGTSIFDILTVDLNTNFHQAIIILYYGARIQNVADSTTYPVHKIIGVNRFNGGAVQFDKQVIQQNGNAQTHADIDAVATSSTNYRIRLTFSGTAGGSSFAAGYVEIIGLGPGTDGAFYSLAHSKGITR